MYTVAWTNYDFGIETIGYATYGRNFNSLIGAVRFARKGIGEVADPTVFATYNGKTHYVAWQRIGNKRTI